MKSSTSDVLPSEICQEAEAASEQALSTVSEIFGERKGNEDWEEDEPPIIRRWKNGGKESLCKALRRAGFDKLRTAAEGVKGA